MVERTSFGKLQAVIDPPDLIEIQTKSYEEFLQMDRAPDKRKDQGLQAVLKEVFPLESYDGRYVLEYVKYTLTAPKMGRVESLYEGQTFAAPLHVTFRLRDGEERREEDGAMG
ncbi:MAG: hypothetical protein O3B24_11540, partial [Verrucomicrobia bacterium]|nr:hypothetical protein [Verrucomicrobiota bacterium]